MAFHTAKSPSQAEKFANCSGSLALCEALPDHQKNISGPAAKLGTCVHFLIEEALGAGKDPEDYRGRVITIANDADETVKLLAKSAKTPSNQYWVEVDDDVIDSATVMTDHVRECLAAIGPTAELELESRTNPLPDRDDTSGTADVTIKDWPVKLSLKDYKNGWNMVEHTGNKQLLGYLLGKAIESDFGFAEYEITVVQPNAEHEDGKIRHFVATAAELQAFAAEYRGYVEACDRAADAPGAPKAGKIKPTYSPAWAAKYLNASKPGDKKDHCMFCDAKPVCSAYVNRVADQANIDFADDPEELPRPSSPPDVAKIMAWKPAVLALMTAAFIYGQRTLEAGFKVPGWKLAKTKPHRRFIKLTSDEIAARLRKEFKLKDEQIFHDALKTGPQIEKLIPKGPLRDKFASTMLYNPEGTLTIVPEDDARDEVLKNASDDFADDLGDNDDDFG